MRSASLTAVLSVCALAPLAARATDVQLGVDLGATYSTNVFGTENNPEDDLNGFVGPRLIVNDATGSFRWNLRYSPRYRRYLSLHELNGWDQDAAGGFAWDIGERTTVQLDARYLDYQNFSQVFTQDLQPNGSFDTGVAFNREDFQQRSFVALIRHDPAERHRLTLEIARYDNHFVRETELASTHSDVTSVTGNYYYTLFPLDSIGVGLSGTRQTIKDQTKFHSDFVNLSFLWRHVFTRTLELNVSAGPTWTRQDPTDTLEVLRSPTVPSHRNADGTFSPFRASTCPRFSDGTQFLGDSCQPFAEDELTIPPFLAATISPLPRQGQLPGDTTGFTYFAEVSLTKNWESARFVLSYLRDATTATETAGSVRDNYSASFNWYPFRRWSFGLYGYYETRDTPAGSGVRYEAVIVPIAGTDVAGATAFRAVPLSDQIQTRSYVASFNVNYQWSDRIQLYLSGVWTTQKIDNPFGAGSKFNGFSTTVGMIYWLPTLQLPF